MATAGDLDSDLEALDAFPMSDRSPEGRMSLGALDGYLTGLAIGPELIPPGEWLPIVWGDNGGRPIFDDEAQAQARSIVGAIMGRYNAVLGVVSEGVVEPVFQVTSDGDLISPI